jgi:molybdopterin/thiamine biosynthesis adenylyltransferase
MGRNSLLAKLKEYGLAGKQAYLDKAFSRNIGLFTRAEQQKLAEAKVAIPGMGGVGGVHLITMVRTGVGRFHLADFDKYEPANVNRQFGAQVPDFGRPKLEVMVERALNINPFLEIKKFPDGINRENMDDFLEGVDVVLDGLDFFCFDLRRLLFNRAREKGIYVITAGPMGFSSAMLIFSPHEGMSFDEYFNITEKIVPPDTYLAFALGLAPRPTHIKYMDLSRVDLESKAGPSLNIACQICSGMAATEAVRIILKKGKVKPVPCYFQFDPYLQKYRKGRLILGNRNPFQQIKMKVVKILLQRKRKPFKMLSPEFPTVKVTAGQAPQEVIPYLIRAGIQAPSGDNVQPWKFSYQGNTILLYLNRDADQSFFNVRQLASIISCGAALENIRVAASMFGLEGKINFLPRTGTDTPIASVELIPRETERSPLSDSLWERNTNRKLYERQPLDVSVIDDLKGCLSDFPGIRLHFVTEAPARKKLAWLIYKADRIRTEYRPLHEYLYQMIRFSYRDAMEKKDGFYLKNLEAGLAGELFLKIARPWWLMNIINAIGLGRMVALHSYQAIVSSSAVALLTVSGVENEDFLKGGQALERIWLNITRKGLAMQPMTAITLFWLRWQMEGEESFMEKHRKLLRNVWTGYRNQFPEIDFSKEGHVMLFRLGYGKEITFGTFRKDWESFLT